MTEPVAYRVKNKGGMDWQLLPFTPRGHYDFIEPLYTAEQLRPRVKMTQAEFDEFNSMPVFASVYGAMLALYSGNVIRYSMLLKRFSGNDGQIKFANLWFYYRIKHKAQGELIEIIPDMKWFVARNDTSDDHRFLSKNVINLDNELNYAALKKSAKQFDTKEEAEKWTNPLTEAVQLPVEGE